MAEKNHNRRVKEAKFKTMHKEHGLTKIKQEVKLNTKNFNTGGKNAKGGTENRLALLSL